MNFTALCDDRRVKKGIFIFGSDLCFVAVAPGLYLRTNACVVEVPCSMCKSLAGEPCRNSRGFFMSSTHYPRRYAAAEKLKKGDRKPR